MTVPAFTPGPWEANRCGEACPNRWNVIAELGENERGIRLIRTIDQVLDYCGADEAEANARLIAAAPRLYEALSDLMENPDFDTAIGGNPEMVEQLIERARAALAQARGE